ncbi:MAG: hypothetical protein HYZ84_07430, partial [Candidatus Omnitrophica bacterium]|nr:hypothetical protein [Candidatus Omnitrophota bacterium]
VSGHGKIGQRGLDAAMDEFVDETGVIGFDRNRLVAIRNRAFNTDLWAKVGRKDFTGTAGYDAQGVYSSASKEAHNRELISAFGVWMPWDEFQAMQTSLAASGGTEEVAEFKAMTVDEILRLAANNPRGLASGLLAYLSDSNVRAGFLAEVQEKVVAPNDVDARLVAASNSEQRVVPTADVANYVIPKNARILAMQYTDGVAPYPIEEAYGNGTYRIVSQQLNWNRRPASLQQSDFAEQILAEISPTETPNLYNFINGPTANDPLRMFDQISLDQNNTSQAISFEEVVSIAILLSVMRNFNYTMILNTTAEKNALIADLTRALKFNPTVAIPNLHIEAAEETRGGYYAVLHRSFSKTQDPTGVFGTNRDELSRLPAAQASLVGLIESNRKTSHVRNVSAFATLLRDLVKNMLVIYNQAVLDRADGATGVAAELKMLASRLMARSA